MCVACHHQTRRFLFRWFIGGWKNITYKGPRGEGHPPPWLMIILGPVGFMAEWHLYTDIRWFRQQPVYGVIVKPFMFTIRF
jgi:hypothetical protein